MWHVAEIYREIVLFSEFFISREKFLDWFIF